MSRGHPAGPTGSSIGRALQVLDAFDVAHRELRLIDVAQRCGMPMSTAHRLLAELAAWGAVERGEDGLFRIGLRLWEVGALAPRGQGLRERALPYLEDLSHITKENVQLAVREGRQTVFIERIAGRDAVPVFTRVGGRFGMTSTGVGLVLLAHAPVVVQDGVLDSPIQRFTPHTKTDPGELRRILADIRIKGFAISNRQITTNTMSVAAPIHDGKERVVAAVSLVVPHSEVSSHNLVQLVRTSARAISRSLRSFPAG